jgi:hypothetical protein
VPCISNPTKFNLDTSPASRACRMTSCCEGPFGAVRLLDRPSCATDQKITSFTKSSLSLPSGEQLSPSTQNANTDTIVDGMKVWTREKESVSLPSQSRHWAVYWSVQPMRDVHATTNAHEQCYQPLVTGVLTRMVKQEVGNKERGALVRTHLINRGACDDNRAATKVLVCWTEQNGKAGFSTHVPISRSIQSLASAIQGQHPCRRTCINKIVMDC